MRPAGIVHIDGAGLNTMVISYTTMVWKVSTTINMKVEAASARSP